MRALRIPRFLLLPWEIEHEVNSEKLDRKLRALSVQLLIAIWAITAAVGPWVSAISLIN